MSLIQEALKRKTEDQGASQQPQPPALPEEKKPERNLKPIITAGIFLVVMGALGLFGYNLITKSFSDDQPITPPETQPITKEIKMPASPLERQKALQEKNAEAVKQAEDARTVEPEAKPRLFKTTAPARKPANWPPIKLSGFATGSNEKLAIINNKIMREGQIVAGATIIKILPNKVVMEFEGEVRSLTAGSE